MFKPPPKNAPKPKPRGGWDDDEEETPKLNSLQQPPSSFFPLPSSASSLPQSSFSPSSSSHPPPASSAHPQKAAEEESIKLSQIQKFGSDFDLLGVEELLERKIEYEQKLIADVVQPQGARIKPQEELMNSLAKACENLQVQIIGSILIASAKEASFWISRVKSLYVIDHLIQKLPVYRKYFEYHLNSIESIAAPSDLLPQKQAFDSIHQKILSYFAINKTLKKMTVINNESNTNSINLSHYSNKNLNNDDLLFMEEKVTPSPQKAFGFVDKKKKNDDLIDLGEEKKLNWLSYLQNPELAKK